MAIRVDESIPSQREGPASTPSRSGMLQVKDCDTRQRSLRAMRTATWPSEASTTDEMPGMSRQERPRRAPPHRAVVVCDEDAHLPARRVRAVRRAGRAHQETQLILLDSI